MKNVDGGSESKVTHRSIYQQTYEAKKKSGKTSRNPPGRGLGSLDRVFIRGTPSMVVWEARICLGCRIRVCRKFPLKYVLLKHDEPCRNHDAFFHLTQADGDDLPCVQSSLGSKGSIHRKAATLLRQDPGWEGMETMTRSASLSDRSPLAPDIE